MKQQKRLMQSSRILVALLLAMVCGCGGGGGGGGPTPTGSIKGQVTAGPAGSGISAVSVTLFDSGGTTVISTATTDATGNYAFNGINYGSYKVRFTLSGPSYVWHQRKADSATAALVTVPSDAINMVVPVTTADPGSMPYTAVSLLASEAATIYYTTNGSDPVIGSSASGSNPVLNIPVNGSTVLKYFAVVDGFIREAIKTWTP